MPYEFIDTEALQEAGPVWQAIVATAPEAWMWAILRDACVSHGRSSDDGAPSFRP